jgi:hypothetical protein
METNDSEDPNIEMKENIDKDLGESLETNSSPSNSLTLELGDIIEIIAPTNPDINEMTAIITYIDQQKIKLINVANSKHYLLNISDEGVFTDESITDIYLLNRSDEKGFAKQNGLVLETWVDLYFGGDFPAIITGQITNVEEDMIEITTYPEIRVIYINFAYQGLPENIPIDKIIIREKPESFKHGSLSLIREQLEEGEIVENGEEKLASMMFTETGESKITIPEGTVADKTMTEVLKELYIDANSIVFGERLEKIVQLVEVPESERRYSIEAQVNDLMDELLSTIPNYQRTTVVLDRIHLLIERFKELRNEFSKFDANQNVYDAKIKGIYFKPLVEHIRKLDYKLQWLLPVVKNRRKIYDADSLTEIPDGALNKLGPELRELENLQLKYYKNNSTDEEINYKNVTSRVNALNSPVELPEDATDCLETTSILTNIDAIVDNLDDFYSNVYTSAGVKRRQYVIERYNLGLTKLDSQVMKSGKTIYTRAPLTPNEKISVKSLVMLPYPVVKFSAIDLPNTNIMDKVSLHQNYFMLFRLFNKNADIIPHVIDDLSKEFDYELASKESQVDFFANIHQFSLNAELFSDPDEKYQKFLEAVVPKTKTLIQLVRKYIKNKVSYLDVIQQLEPFMIYPNDITYTQYKDIRYIMKERIRELAIEYEKKFADFSFIRNEKYNVPQRINPVIRLLSEKPDFAETFFKNYDFLFKDGKIDSNISSEEMLMKIMEMDSGTLYLNVITSIMISLMTPTNLMDFLAPNETSEDMSDLEKIKPTDCTRRYLAKKYDSLKDLQGDNNNDEVYYDKDFDETPYEILKKYEAEQKRMMPTLFLEFIEETLVHKHDCPKELAKDLAATLIAKKKLVRDGDYAILEIKPKLPEGVNESDLSAEEKSAVETEAEIRKKTQYYKRLKNNWVSDNDIDDIGLVDTNTLFCNVSATCFKNTKNQVCESNEESINRIKEITKNRLKGEFDKRYEISVEELEKTLDKNIEYHLKLLKKSKALRDIQLYKANNLAVALGGLANTQEIITSSHTKLRDLIMGQSNFSKKQRDICKLVDEYCRDPMVENLEESPHWKYCKDTNVKLFPQSVYELALAFISGENYLDKLNEICHKYGELSCDESSIVDKHSGFFLRKRDFSNDEGFGDAGFKITSHEIMEKDLGTVVMEAISKNKKPVFESETSEMIYNVFSAICENIDIPVESISEFVLRTSNEIITKDILSKESYTKKSEAAFKKTGKYFKVTYENYKNETSIVIVASVLIIAIQTAIPSFQTKRTHPGCVRSFSGYPMDGIEDLTGVQYIACVLNKTKSNISPWMSIQSYKADTLAKRIKDVLEKNIMNRSDIGELYVKKREFVLLNPDLIAPAEHNVAKWTQFMPPIVNFSIEKKIRNVASDFESDLVELLRKGSRSQLESINVLKSKILFFGYGVIETINGVVKQKDTLLKTSGGIPFIENACCNNATNSTNPIVYFNEEDNNIALYRNATVKLANMLRDRVLAPSKAAMFYFPDFSGLRSVIVPSGFLEETVYSAIFQYCNFDVKLPIPEEYKSIVAEKPPRYNPNWTIQEKIEFMKSEGKRFDLDTLHQLMTLVRNKNLITIEPAKTFTQVDVLKEIVENLDMGNSTIIEEPLRKFLYKIMDKYDPNVYMDRPLKELDDLTDYITGVNIELYKRIRAFFDKFASFISDREFENTMEFLTNIHKWNLDKPRTQSKRYYDDGLHNATQFIKNAIYMFSKVYPNVLLNDSGFFKNVPKHWGVSKKHEDDITRFVDTYYKEIEKFKGDPVLMQLLQEVNVKLNDVSMFVENIPIFTEIVLDTVDDDSKPKTTTLHSLFDKHTIYLLYTYCFYSSIYEYILCSEDVNLLRTDVQESKSQRRASIKDSKNPASTLQSIDETGEDIEGVDDLREVAIVTGDVMDLQQRVCSLIYTFLNIEQTNKKKVDFSYEQIMQKVGRSKEKEKQNIIKYLGDMSIEERRIENMFKNYRLERWNVGQQAGLIRYDKDTYDRERDELLTQLYTEAETGALDNHEELLDVYQLEQLESVIPEDEDRGFNLDDVGENFMDGEYYEEDRDDFMND